LEERFSQGELTIIEGWYGWGVESEEGRRKGGKARENCSSAFVRGNMWREKEVE